MLAFFGTALAFVRRYPALVGGIAAAIAVVITVALLINHGVQKERKRQEAEAAAAIIKADERNAAAVGRSDTERQADQADAAATQKELNDAVKALPDSVPSARRVALGCARLRRAGQDTSGLSQCS